MIFHFSIGQQAAKILLITTKVPQHLTWVFAIWRLAEVTSAVVLLSAAVPADEYK
jgi:hypothetical protein